MIKILTFISFFINSISKHINNDLLDSSINYNIPAIFDCPERECNIFCENGHKKDENGCNICDCNNNSNRLLGDDNSLTTECSQLQYAVMNQCNSNCHVCDFQNTISVLDQCFTNDGLKASDNLCNPDDITSCPIPYNDCDLEYVCPKITEITQCSEGGISGYTTYQLSLIIKNPLVKNIYAIYGDNTPIEYPMSIPGAFQGSSIFNNNIGGIAPELIAINHDALYDSWLTVGITNGDPLNKISTIGIDFNSWDENTPLYITNGAVFVMNPTEITSTNNEYIIAQLTIPNEVITDAIINVQGKLNCNHCDNSWKQYQIHFHLEKPKHVNPNYIPLNCISWYDGCNTCFVLNGQLNGCTRKMCFRQENPHCLEFDRSGH